MSVDGKRTKPVSQQVTEREAKGKRLREINDKLYPFGKSVDAKERIAWQDEAVKPQSWLPVLCACRYLGAYAEEAAVIAVDTFRGVMQGNSLAQYAKKKR